MDFETHGSIFLDSLILVFTKYKCTWLTTISMSLLAALPAKMSAFNNLMQQNVCHRNTKWTFADLLPCYCYAIKTNSRKIRSRLSQPTSAGKGGDMSEPQAHHCMTLQLWTWLLCSVSFIQAKKLSLQESNQLIGTKIPTSGFSRNIWFLIPISRLRANARFASPALRMPMRSLIVYIGFHKQGQLI